MVTIVSLLPVKSCARLFLAEPVGLRLIASGVGTASPPVVTIIKIGVCGAGEDSVLI